MSAVITLVLAASVPHAAPPPKAQPPCATCNPRVPDDLIFSEAVDEVKDRHHFNDFSWKQFVAVSWPAVAGRRGEPDVGKPFGADADQVVWGTWKSLDELFPPDPRNTPPTVWDSYDAELDALRPAKGLMKDAGKRKILTQAIRLGTVSQGGFSARKLPPLIAQNGTYVRYEVRVNKVAYEFIRDNQYYLRETFTGGTAGGRRPISFPDGSIVVKAAWMELKDTDPRERFYRVRAEIEELTGEDPVRHELRPATVGLVGLHIAQKTSRRPSWIWSTFEHVDNTEPGPGADRASFSTNDPAVIHDEGFVDDEPALLDETKPLPPNPTSVDVQRATAVHPTTHNVNLQYQRSRDIKGTVWQNYRLVATQWIGKPDPGDPSLFGVSGADVRARVFPKNVANTTIETYRQTNSCIVCHASAEGFGFMFYPSIRAHPRTDP